MNQTNTQPGEHQPTENSPPGEAAPKSKTFSFSAHKSRWLSGLPLFILVASAVLWGPVWILALIMGLGAVLALRELDQMLDAGGSGLESWLNRIWGAATLGLACWGTGPVIGGCMAALALCALTAMALSDEPKAIRNSMLTRGFGLVYCVLPLASLVLLAGLNGGRALLLFSVICVAAADVGAYYAGHAWGKNKMAPLLSPGKTWEGLVGGQALAALMGLLAGLLGIIDQATWQLVLAALLLAALSVVGDLWESVLKRSAGVKDSGAILPGHGGVLDRIDGLLLAGPAMYLIKVLWWM